MICDYPRCGCKIDLPHGQLFPKHGECPLCECARTNLGLDALAYDLFELFVRAPRVWDDEKRMELLEQSTERCIRLRDFARKQYKNGGIRAHS